MLFFVLFQKKKLKFWEGNGGFFLQLCKNNLCFVKKKRVEDYDSYRNKKIDLIFQVFVFKLKGVFNK